MSGSTIRFVDGLREASRRYRGVLFNAALLRKGSLSSVQLQHCSSALLGLDKRVAIVDGAPYRAASLRLSLESRAKVSDRVGFWTSGEFVHRALAGPPESDFRKSLGSAVPLESLANEEPAKIFELSSLAKPRRWAEFMDRGGPLLTDLGKAKRVKRTADIEDADLVLWDAGEGDTIAYMEATLELCSELKVPLVQLSRSTEACLALTPSHRKDSPEASAVSLKKMGGAVFGIGKCLGLPEGLGWEELGKQDVLLVSGDIGDVLEASQVGLDCLLVLTDEARAQLRAFRAAAEAEEAGKRKSLSMSQRVAEDKTGMLQSVSNPMWSVFQLPSLLAEATRKNAEHRASKAEQEKKAAAAAQSRTETPQAAPLEPPEPTTASDEELMELLELWCKAIGAPTFRAVISTSQLVWDPQEAVGEDSAAGLAESGNGNGNGSSSSSRQGSSRRAVGGRLRGFASDGGGGGGGGNVGNKMMEEEGWDFGKGRPMPAGESLNDILGSLSTKTEK